MKIIDNSVEEYIQEPGVDGMYKAIRDAAAICYQTDIDKMTDPKDFTEHILLKNGHTRPLEFGTVYLKMSADDAGPLINSNPYTKHIYIPDEGCYYITTNLRVLAQGGYSTDEEAYKNKYDKNWFGYLSNWCEPCSLHDIRRTFKIICSRGAGDDFRTHITLSSMMESTRYCDYSKHKFQGEVTFIRPYWFTETDNDGHPKCGADNDIISKELGFRTSMQLEEQEYLKCASEGYQAQQLKRLYPLGAKVELRLCGFDAAWKNFFWRRCDHHADPECRVVAQRVSDIYHNGAF